MDYHLYFHDDFDGIVSAAILYDFFTKKGDEIISFNPLEYNLDIQNNWKDYELKNPSILVDFRFHKKADVWFDHHASNLTNPDFVNYHADEWHFLDPKAKSCAGMILKFLTEKHEYIAPKNFGEISIWADIIDSAGFEKPQDMIELDNPFVRLDRLIDFYPFRGNPAKMTVFESDLIKSLASQSAAEIVSRPENNEIIEKVYASQKNRFTKMPSALKATGNSVVWDDTVLRLDLPRSLVFYFYPEALYGIMLGRENGVFHLSVYKNNWSAVRGKINLGEYFNKFGGGGHNGIGACRITEEIKVRQIMEEVINYLNQNG